MFRFTHIIFSELGETVKIVIKMTYTKIVVNACTHTHKKKIKKKIIIIKNNREEEEEQQQEPFQKCICPPGN